MLEIGKVGNGGADGVELMEGVVWDIGVRSEVTCYVINVDTSYNLLLGRP